MSDEIEVSPVLKGNALKSENTEDGGIVRALYDWSSMDPSTAVVETVSVAADRGAIDLEPLYGTIDPDALNALVRSGVTNDPHGAMEISFDFAGRQVTVRSSGEIAVRSTTDHE